MTNTKGHLLFIHRSFPPDSGASALRLYELAQGLAENGWQITILANRGRTQALKNQHANITVKRLSHGGEDQKTKGINHLVWPLRFLLHANKLPKIDLAITLTDPPLSAITTALLRRFKKIPVIHWVHDLYPDIEAVCITKKTIWHHVAHKISRWSLRQHDKIVTLGDDMNRVLSHDITPDTKLIAISNWPDVYETTIEKEKAPLRSSNTNPFITEGIFTVLYSGNFGQMHEFRPLIDAIKLVHTQPLPIRFIFAGDGQKFTQVRDEIESHFLTNVHFIRAQPKERFMDLLRAGDIHISSMISKAAGLVAPSKINSALGLGKPCLYIGPPQASQARLISEYKAGFVIDVTDSHAKFKIADAIVQLANHKDQYKDMQENALKAAKTIAFSGALVKFETIIQDVINKK